MAAVLAVASEVNMTINFTRLFVFGDSISDAGRLPEPFRPDPPYVDGRFTNGLVYAQILPQELSVASNNYAYGGAKALASGPEQALIGLDAQVTEFETGYLFSAPRGSAAAIFKKVFDDYRHSYILRYSAEGVSSRISAMPRKRSGYFASTSASIAVLRP